MTVNLLKLIGKIVGIILLGFFGASIYRVGEHLYTDHTNLHFIVNSIQQQLLSNSKSEMEMKKP